ncbi:MAG: apolipoprotein N-acyltransferase [Candidatus Brocadiae bacterium]|nr:apolipoprotein N-acyltransferase [Candidatus Brocadiia bacterium]
MASALLLRLAFPVPGWFPLAWVALVPWLVVVSAGSRRATVWGSVATGLVAAGLGLSWQYIVTLPGATLLTLYVGFYFPLFACVVRVARGKLRLPLWLAAPVVWTGLEYLRSWLFTGFPWLFLGHTQRPFLLLIQVCDLFGAYALSFVVMASNAALAEAVVAWRARQWPVRRLAVGASVALALVAATLVYGHVRLKQLDCAEGPRVGIVQGNIPQEVKNTLTIETICDIFMQHWRTTLDMKAATGDEPLDLIVWPESMVQWPLNWIEQPEDVDFATPLRAAAEKHGVALPDGVRLDLRPLLWALARQMKCPLLVGAHTIVGRDRTLLAPHDGIVDRITDHEITFDGRAYPLPVDEDAHTGRRPHREVFVAEGQRVDDGATLIKYSSVVFNSAYLFRPSGPTEPIERYDKLHLVPFGEYVPLKDLLWFVLPAVPYSKGFSHGVHDNLLTVGQWPFGVLICFEDAFPRVVRRFVVRDDGQAAAFLINISNDGWFKDSHELDQHMAICGLRAVEFRTGIVRCTNTGISGILAPDGRVQSLVRDARGGVKAVRGFTVGRVRLRGDTTFYARHGDLLAAACFAVAAVAFFVGAVTPVARRLRRKDTP